MSSICFCYDHRCRREHHWPEDSNAILEQWIRTGRYHRPLQSVRSIIQTSRTARWSIEERCRGAIESSGKYPRKSWRSLVFCSIPSFQFGEEILLELNAKNKSDQNRTMAVVLTVCIAASTNQRWIACHDQPIENLTLKAGKGRFPSFSNGKYTHFLPR